MSEPDLCAVTGAFGFTGRFVTRILMSQGKRVITLTGNPGRDNPYGDRLRKAALDFDRPADLVRSLQGASTLYNTYWVRYAHGDATFDRAVANTHTLIAAAREAGVQRIVHVSIANPSADSPLPYYSGKAALERAIADSGMSYAFVRPTVVFGRGDILINNIAWFLRRFPYFAVPGDGRYRIQPIYVEDLATIMTGAGARHTNETIDAVGPETFTFDELLYLLRNAVHSRTRLVHVPPGIALTLSTVVGRIVGDVVLTREEVRGLMAGLLASDLPPTGTTLLSAWLIENAREVGIRYASEIKRHFRRG
jgi:uncharacterized protein YbjT (DUF2867 family)